MRESGRASARRSRRIPTWLSVLHEFVERIGVGTVDEELVHDRDGVVELVDGNLPLFLGRPRRLSAKLVARDAHDGKILILLKQIT